MFFQIDLATSFWLNGAAIVHCYTFSYTNWYAVIKAHSHELRLMRSAGADCSTSPQSEIALTLRKAKVKSEESILNQLEAKHFRFYWKHQNGFVRAKVEWHPALLSASENSVILCTFSRWCLNIKLEVQFGPFPVSLCLNIHKYFFLKAQFLDKSLTLSWKLNFLVLKHQPLYL